MTPTRRALILLVAAATFGCGPAVNSMSFISPALPPTPSDYPIRFYGQSHPKCPFEEVGSVSARRKSKLTSMDKVMDGLRDRARKMGGEAVIGIGEKTETRGAIFTGPTIVANRDEVVSGTVIRFTDPACTQ